MLNEFRSTNITWDKATSRIYSPVTANASDENGRKLVVQIVNGGQVEDLTGATLHLYWETRAKAHHGLDVFKAVNLKKGEFELSYTTGMLSNHGVLNANLVLIDTVGRVVSERFKITVTEGIDNGAIQSENSFSSLTQALIDISNLEQNYAPRLNDLTAQLQHKIDEVKYDTYKQIVLFYANDRLINTVNISEAGNAEAVQSYIDTLVDNGQIQGVTLAEGSVSPVETTFINRTENLFDGIYHNFSVSGAIGSSALLANGIPAARTAIVPIEQGKTYTVKVHEPDKSDAFRIATHTTIPEFVNVSVMQLTSLLTYNDILKQSTFTADVSGYAFVTVSNKGSEPLLQIEEGDMATGYVPYHVIREELVSETIQEHPKVQEAAKSSKTANSRLDERMLFPKIANVTMVKTDPGPRFVEYFDDKMWGYTFINGDISYSTDEGKTWTVHTNKESAFSGAVHRLLPTDDGEVLAMTSNGLYKSEGWEAGSVSWSESKITKHANATLFQFGLDGDGTKFIIAEYGGSIPNWPDSRYVWVSTDMGETFNVVWDSLSEHGEAINNVTHLHGVAYDRWDDRFYFSEGHGPKGGLRVSLDDGSTWSQPSGYRDGALKSGGIQGYQTENDTNGPTVLVATPTGLVMGSDNANNGMFGLVKKKNINDEVITHTYNANGYKPGYLSMFAIRGFYDDKSGTVYIAFRSEYSDVPPIILAGTPTEADLVYEYPNLPVVGAQDHFGAIAKVDDGRLVAYAQFNGIPHTLKAVLVYPASELQTMIRLELKKLGII